MARSVLFFILCFSCGVSKAGEPKEGFLNHFRIDYPADGIAVVFDLSSNVEVSCAVDAIKLKYKDEVSISGALWWKKTEIISEALKFNIVDHETNAVIASSSLGEFEVTVSGYYYEHDCTCKQSADHP